MYSIHSDTILLVFLLNNMLFKPDNILLSPHTQILIVIVNSSTNSVFLLIGPEKFVLQNQTTINGRNGFFSSFLIPIMTTTPIKQNLSRVLYLFLRKTEIHKYVPHATTILLFFLPKNGMRTDQKKNKKYF